MRMRMGHTEWTDFVDSANSVMESLAHFFTLPDGEVAPWVPARITVARGAAPTSV